MNTAANEYSSITNFPGLIGQNEQYLGPAQVIGIAGKRLKLDVCGANIWAIAAIAYPYKPERGDSVLAIGLNGNFYVIGVLEGTGKTTFTAPGDIKFMAPTGQIDMVAARGFRIRSPRVKITAENLELSAKKIVEQFEYAKRWIKETFQLKAGSMRTQVDSTYRINANKIVEKAKEDVNIDGNRINLG